MYKVGHFGPKGGVLKWVHSVLYFGGHSFSLFLPFVFLLTTMRTVSLVNRLKWSFAGNMNPHALELGDVDNDGVRDL
jgi:hypothetical protein